MNKRSEELSRQAWEYADQNERKEDNHGILYRDKLIELVVQECVNIVMSRCPLGQSDNKMEGWTNGYGDGLKTAAWLITQHFDM